VPVPVTVVRTLPIALDEDPDRNSSAVRITELTSGIGAVVGAAVEPEPPLEPGTVVPDDGMVVPVTGVEPGRVVPVTGVEPGRVVSVTGVEPGTVVFAAGVGAEVADLEYDTVTVRFFSESIFNKWPSSRVAGMSMRMTYLPRGRVFVERPTS
jgi:hypothetical protein